MSIHTLENVWLKQLKIWIGQPNNLVGVAPTKCLVETNQTARPTKRICGSYPIQLVAE
jgi:hypothetical protein